MLLVGGGAQQGVVMEEGCLLHLSVVREHPAIRSKAKDAVLLSSERALPVEEARVSIAVFEVGYAGARDCVIPGPCRSETFLSVKKSICMILVSGMHFSHLLDMFYSQIALSVFLRGKAAPNMEQHIVFMQTL